MRPTRAEPANTHAFHVSLRIICTSVQMEERKHKACVCVLLAYLEGEQPSKSTDNLGAPSGAKFEYVWYLESRWVG